MRVLGLASWRIFPIFILWQLTRASLHCGNQGNNNNHNNASDNDEDDDNGDGNSSSQRSHFPSSTSSCIASGTGSSLPKSGVLHDGVSKAAVAGIVVGLVLGLLALFALGLCCWIRYRRSRGLRTGSTTLIPEPTNKPEAVRGDGESSTRLLGDPSVQQVTASTIPTLPMLPRYTAISSRGDAEHAPRAMTTATTTMRNVTRSVSVSSLPNPHNPDGDPTGVLLISRGEHADQQTNRDLPPLPDSPTSSSPPLPSSSFLSDLSRGLTQTSHLTSMTTGTRISLHDEMARYQKRLEVHHEKEMSAAGGSGVPADPPPEYREADEEDAH